MSPSDPSGDPRNDFEVTFFLFWFLVTGAYMGIASWALFSSKGREYLTNQEQIPIKGRRTLLWYLKFLVACYAAAFASLMLLGVLAIPVVGSAGLEAMVGENSWFYFLIVGLIWSPLIFRHLDISSVQQKYFVDVSLRRNIKIIVVIGVLIFVVSPIASYFIVRAGEPFEYTKQVITSSSSVRNVLGEVKEIKLAPFRSYSVRYINSEVWARFETEVIGEKGKGTLYVKLEKKGGNWKILDASLNGQQINLGN